MNQFSFVKKRQIGDKKIFPMLNESLNFGLNLEACEWNIQAKFPKTLDGKGSDLSALFYSREIPSRQRKLQLSDLREKLSISLLH